MWAFTQWPRRDLAGHPHCLWRRFSVLCLARNHGLPMAKSGRRQAQPTASTGSARLATRNISIAHPLNARWSSRQSSVLPVDAAEEILRANEISQSPAPSESITMRYDANVVASNPKCEDEAAHAFVDGRHFYAVFDGHAGADLSRALARSLIPRVAAELRKGSVASDSDVSAAVKRAFIQLDDEICSPGRFLAELRSTLDGADPKLARSALVQLHARWRLAMQGSCALLAIFDEANDRMHIAVTGDSRAVMGTWDPKQTPGSVWRTRVLSEDQTSANPKEAHRLQSEHPKNEAQALVKDGRTLDLGMSRAFGDSMFKWSAADIRTISKAISGRAIAPYPECKTPPYITAEPQVISLPLHSPHGRRFVVLGSDGVYEWLSNAEIVGLVGGALDGLHGHHSRAAVLAATVMDDHPVNAYLPKPFPGPGKWGFTFEDANIATHVIRNAISGDNKRALQLQCSLPPTVSRKHRDDMTVIVVVLEDLPPDSAGRQGDEISPKPSE